MLLSILFFILLHNEKKCTYLLSFNVLLSSTIDFALGFEIPIPFATSILISLYIHCAKSIMLIFYPFVSIFQIMDKILSIFL